MRLRIAPKAAVRPTASNARQVLFDILGPQVIGTRWLDLYAGSGAVGLEALSRGASECVFVESSHRCAETLRKNIAHLAYEARCRLIDAPVIRTLRKLAAEQKPFDFIFLDPPYEGDEAKRCLSALGEPLTASALLAENGLVIGQLSVHSEIIKICGVLSLERERRVGDTRLLFYRRQMETSGAKG